MGPEWGKRKGAVLVGFLYLHEILISSAILSHLDVCTVITVFAQIQGCDTGSG